MTDEERWVRCDPRCSKDEIGDSWRPVAEPSVTVTRDTLDGWIEDALTQGIPPFIYICNVLTAALPEED